LKIFFGQIVGNNKNKQPNPEISDLSAQKKRDIHRLIVFIFAGQGEIFMLE
jgi:hypothetical protein